MSSRRSKLCPVLQQAHDKSKVKRKSLGNSIAEGDMSITRSTLPPVERPVSLPNKHECHLTRPQHAPNKSESKRKALENSVAEVNTGRRRSKRRRRRQVETPKSGNLQILSFWGDLPSNIGHLILDKLPDVLEHIRFGAVCKGWYTILKQYQPLVKPFRNFLPMLLVPSPSNDEAKRQPPLLFALSSLGKNYSNLRLPLSYSHRRYVGCSNGWVATQNSDFTFTLLYPFGREIRTIHLPSFMPPNWYFSSEGCYWVRKLIVSPDSTPSDYTAVAIYSLNDEFATIKAGEKSWVRINTRSRTMCGSYFNDVIFHRRAVYVVERGCSIIKVDVHTRPPVIKGVHRLFRNTNPRIPYLVVSTSSELYLLQRFYHCTCNHYDSRTSRFNIFKLKMRRKKGEEFMTTKKSVDLKGDTFFIGQNTSASMAVKSTGCIPNSIYFMDENYCFPYPKQRYTVGYYSIGDGSVRSIYETKITEKKHVCQPIWIVPQKHAAPSDQANPHLF